MRSTHISLRKLRLACTCEMDQYCPHSKTCFTCWSEHILFPWIKISCLELCSSDTDTFQWQKGERNDSFQKYTGTAHYNSEMFTSVSFKCDITWAFFIGLEDFGTGNSSSTPPPPQFQPFWFLLWILEWWPCELPPECVVWAGLWRLPGWSLLTSALCFYLEPLVGCLLS